MSQRRPYTDYEMGYVADNMTRPIAEQAEFLGRPQHAITSMRRVIRSGWTRNLEPWTADEDDLIRRHAESLSASGLAELLPGRSIEATTSRRKRLGIVVGSPYRNDPHTVGARTLIARTCPKCGNLLPGKWFRVNSGGGQFRGCKKCLDARNPSPAKRADKKRAQNAWRDRIQAATAATATRSGFEYSEADHVIMSDPSTSILSKALAMKRTYNATNRAVSVNGYKSARWLGNSADDRWLIDNPNAARAEEITAAVKREFAAAGIPLPQWDWDDEDLEISA